MNRQILSLCLLSFLILSISSIGGVVGHGDSHESAETGDQSEEEFSLSLETILLIVVLVSTLIAAAILYKTGDRELLGKLWLIAMVLLGLDYLLFKFVI